MGRLSNLAVLDALVGTFGDPPEPMDTFYLDWTSGGPIFFGWDLWGTSWTHWDLCFSKRNLGNKLDMV